ncbi:dUTP diphosphatase [Oceanobacillus caeni]|uniref:dUTP diphosphatase n=1 Tax=Oceanobacillus caeni TaxID=405946 RepID=UPI00364101EA
MNLQNLFEIQAGLDFHIKKEKGLEGQNLLDLKILALQVELGELANELPEVFKFWSNKKNDYEKALKEYVDGLHFILSIGLELGADKFLNSSVDWSYMDEKDVVKLFSNLFVINWDILNDNDYFEYFEGFEYFMTLGRELGFTLKQVEQAYLEKNKINHQRQISGY